MPSNTTNRKIKVYCCAECGNVETAKSTPKGSQCRVHGFHRWVNLGEEGGTAYKCTHCGISVRTITTPSSYGCRELKFHKWVKGR